MCHLQAPRCCVLVGGCEIVMIVGVMDNADDRDDGIDDDD